MVKFTNPVDMACSEIKGISDFSGWIKDSEHGYLYCDFYKGGIQRRAILTIKDMTDNRGVGKKIEDLIKTAKSKIKYANHTRTK